MKKKEVRKVESRSSSSGTSDEGSGTEEPPQSAAATTTGTVSTWDTLSPAQRTLLEQNEMQKEQVVA